jgi:hypothetical protein
MHSDKTKEVACTTPNMCERWGSDAGPLSRSVSDLSKEFEGGRNMHCTLCF